MRNQEKDEIEMAARRESMLEEGFRLFSQKGIENVTMQEVAKACGLGIATLYRYYNTKLDLVLDIGTHKWEEYAVYSRKYREECHTYELTAAGQFGIYLDFYIDLYKNHRDLLCFNQSLNNYVRHEHATAEQLKPYIKAIDMFREGFDELYRKGQQDGTIRTDTPADEMFAATCHIMLAVIVRYAQGLLYSAENEADRISECELLKQMIMREYVI